MEMAKCVKYGREMAICLTSRDKVLASFEEVSVMEINTMHVLLLFFHSMALLPSQANDVIGQMSPLHSWFL
jgi:hypothetical protein